ncbi:MAG: hypothetical protein GEV06_24460 [Luteitalea sp.]|nr:hypothetical protein [Luteitalea sp.]
MAHSTGMSRMATSPSAETVVPSAAMPHLPPGRFFGGIERQWSSALLNVSIVRHDAARSVPEHSHTHTFIMLLLKGRSRSARKSHTRTSFIQSIVPVMPPGTNSTSRSRTLVERLVRRDRQADVGRDR